MAGCFALDDNSMPSFHSLFRSISDAVVEKRSIYDPLCELVNTLGFQFFSYVIAQKPGSGQAGGIVLSNYPSQWLTRYRSKSYDQVDAIVCSGLQERLPFEWGSSGYVAKLNPAAKQVCVEAQEFGIGEGFAVPVHGPKGECGVLSAVRSVDSRTPFEPWSDRHFRLLALAPLVHAFGIETTIAEPCDDGDAVSLTSREQSCLKWTLEGKTAWEVSRILGISKPTVEYHVQKAMKKLSASNKTHAAALASRRGLI